jgi:heat shock protein HslJ
MAFVRSTALAGACTVVLAACAGPGQSAQPAAGGGAEQGLRWTIGPALVDCVGVAPTSCLEYRDAPNGPWKRFHGVIEGFEFRPGHETDILVRQEPIPRPPADAPSRRTILVREIERRPITTSSLPPALAGTAWQLVSMPGAEPAVPAARVPTLGFDATARVAGLSGVNRYGARVDAGPGWLRVGGAMSTRMAGSPEAMALESEFLSRLQRAGGWRTDGERLRLLDAKGLELMVLQRAAPGSGS